MTPDAIYGFYMAVADASPLPVVLYSFPGVVADIDMSSDLLIRISAHPNVVGTKFTCGNSGKLARVARAMGAMTPNNPIGYWAVGGLADFILQALVAGGSGVIAGGANITPKVCVKVFDLYRSGKLKEAMEMQALLAEGDWVHTAAGVGGTKAVLDHFVKYGGGPRAPLKLPSPDTVQTLVSGMTPLLEMEKSL